MSEDIYDALEPLGRRLLEAHGSREAVAIACGYLPARIAWNGKSTYGLPLIMIADFAGKKGLKMDWRGIEYEAAKEGADIRGEIEEAQREARMMA